MRNISKMNEAGKEKTRILGIDPGEKRIGLALSDPLGITAQGLSTLELGNPNQAAVKIAEIIRGRGVKLVVMGLPLNMDGSAGIQAARARKLGTEIEAKSGVPVIYRDERLTSRQAEQVLLQADLSRRKRKTRVDRLAAQLILQSYLEQS